MQIDVYDKPFYNNIPKFTCLRIGGLVAILLNNLSWLKTKVQFGIKATANYQILSQLQRNTQDGLTLVGVSLGVQLTAVVMQIKPFILCSSLQVS